MKRLTDADLAEVEDVRLTVVDILLTDLRRYKAALGRIREKSGATPFSYCGCGKIADEALADDEEGEE